MWQPTLDVIDDLAPPLEIIVYELPTYFWLPAIDRIDDLAPVFGIVPLLIKLGEGIFAVLIQNEDVFSKITSRIYPATAPQNADLPLVVYYLIAATRIATIDGPTKLWRDRIQIDCRAKTKKGAAELADAVRCALDGYTGPAGSMDIVNIRLEGEVVDYEGLAEIKEAQEFVAKQDYIMSFQRN